MRSFNRRMIAQVSVIAVVLLSPGWISASFAAPKAEKRWLPGANGTLWVTNRVLNNVTAFDAATGTVLGTISVGEDPNGVVAPHDTGKVYVSNEKSNTISVIDKRSMRVIQTIELEPNTRPHHITEGPNGKFVYFGEFGTNKVGVIDTRTNTLTHYNASTDPKARTHAVFATPNGNILLAANTAINEAAALDANTGAILWSVKVSSNATPGANNPSEVLPDTSGKLAYATVRADNKLVVIDMKQRSIVGEVPVGVEPDTLALSPNGKTLVVGLRDKADLAANKSATIAVVDTDTLTIKSVAVPGATTGHQTMSSNGRYTFVVVESYKEKGDPAGVAVVSHRTNRVVTLYEYPGGGRPHGLFFEADRLQR